MGDRKGENPYGRWGGEELGGVERGETVFRLYCLRKGYFSIKGKENFKRFF